MTAKVFHLWDGRAKIAKNDRSLEQNPPENLWSGGFFAQTRQKVVKTTWFVSFFVIIRREMLRNEKNLRNIDILNQVWKNRSIH